MLNGTIRKLSSAYFYSLLFFNWLAWKLQNWLHKTLALLLTLYLFRKYSYLLTSCTQCHFVSFILALHLMQVLIPMLCLSYVCIDIFNKKKYINRTVSFRSFVYSGHQTVCRDRTNQSDWFVVCSYSLPFPHPDIAASSYKHTHTVPQAGMRAVHRACDQFRAVCIIHWINRSTIGSPCIGPSSSVGRSVVQLLQLPQLCIPASNLLWTRSHLTIKSTGHDECGPVLDSFTDWYFLVLSVWTNRRTNKTVENVEI